MDIFKFLIANAPDCFCGQSLINCFANTSGLEFFRVVESIYPDNINLQHYRKNKLVNIFEKHEDEFVTLSEEDKEEAIALSVDRCTRVKSYDLPNNLTALLILEDNGINLNDYTASVDDNPKLDAVKFMVSRNLLDRGLVKSILTISSPINYDVVSYLHNNGYEINIRQDVTDCKILRIFPDINISIRDFNICLAEYQVEDISYLCEERGCLEFANQPNVYYHAAKNKQPAGLIRYLRNAGFVWSSECLAEILQNNYATAAIWMARNGCPVDEKCVSMAYVCGQQVHYLLKTIYTRQLTS